jgi:hypothetical protein
MGDKWLGNTIRLHKYFRRENDITDTALETSPPNVIFMWDLIGPRLATWNVLLGQLAMVQLLHVTNQILLEPIRDSVYSMYRVLFMQMYC